MIKSPCADCTDRYRGCHSECSRYYEFKQDLEKVREIRYKENEKRGEVLRYNRYRSKRPSKRGK